MRRACVILVCLAALSTAHAATAVRQFEVTTPRSFGYVIGDLIRHEIRLELSKPYRLEQQSLPEGGRLNRWIELRSPRLHVKEKWDSRVYEITLIYQIFNVGKDLQTVFTPQHTITFTEQNRSLPLVISQWGFTVAPVTANRAGSTVELHELRPDRKPSAMPLTAHLLRFALAAIGLAITLFYLAYAHWTIPFMARNNGPFAQACRRLKKLQNKRCDETGYRQALQHAHHAFNQTAGRALFVENLDDFFAENPKYCVLRAPIEDLFARSWTVFFTADAIGEESDGSLKRLFRLCHECRDVERGLT